MKHVAVLMLLLSAGAPAPSQTEPAKTETIAEIAVLKQKAGAGDIGAQITLAHAYEDGNGVPRNDNEAAKWYSAAAAQGDAESQNNLGVMYLLGHGVDKDLGKALELYRKAALQGYAAAMFNLGSAYYNGDGVQVDDVTAYAWMLLGKDRGNAHAADAVKRMQQELPAEKRDAGGLVAAELLLRGEVKGGPLAAIRIYENLAEHGNPTAQVRLATIYLEGRVVEKNVSLARSYCERAAGHGFVAGMVCMGYLYQAQLLGEGHYGDARSWFEKAAKLGSPVAMYSLGVLYAKGEGVPVDKTAAWVWFAMAARGGIVAGASAAQDMAKGWDEKQLKRAREITARKLLNSPMRGLSLFAEDREFPYAVKYAP